MESVDSTLISTVVSEEELGANLRALRREPETLGELMLTMEIVEDSAIGECDKSGLSLPRSSVTAMSLSLMTKPA